MMAVTPQGGSTVNTSYTWDNANRLSAIYQGSGGCASTGNPAVGFAYDNASRRTTLALPNGVTVAYSYDKNSRVSLLNYSLGSTQLGQVSYFYDNDGRVTGKGGSLASIALPQSVSGNVFNADNAMTDFGSQTLTYDGSGNLIADGTNTYNWDARNHLTSISGAVAASFIYDPFGRRMSKTINGATTQFVYDGLNPVQELDGASPPNVTANVLTGLGIDEYFSRTDSNGTMSFLRDTLGSTLALANSSGALGTTYTYEPFGKTTTGGPSNANPYQFTGRENDGTGLYFYRARYYSPTFQRFIAQDPIGFGGGDPNIYAYVRNSVVNLIDLLGLLTQDEVGIIVFNEEGSLSGPGLFDAEVATARAIINGARRPRGDFGRPKTANPWLPYPLPASATPALQMALAAAAQAEAETDCGTDPTHGATHFGLVGPSTPNRGPFRNPMPYGGNPAYGVQALDGPFDNSFTYGDVPDASNVFVMIYSGP